MLGYIKVNKDGFSFTDLTTPGLLLAVWNAVLLLASWRAGVSTGPYFGTVNTRRLQLCGGATRRPGNGCCAARKPAQGVDGACWPRASGESLCVCVCVCVRVCVFVCVTLCVCVRVCAH